MAKEIGTIELADMYVAQKIHLEHLQGKIVELMRFINVYDNEAKEVLETFGEINKTFDEVRDSAYDLFCAADLYIHAHMYDVEEGRNYFSGKEIAKLKIVKLK